MGFFSDLKEDLSQAVNELMPAESEEVKKDGKEEEALSLDEMLKNIDSIQLSPENEDEISSDLQEDSQNEDAAETEATTSVHTQEDAQKEADSESTTETEEIDLDNISDEELERMLAELEEQEQKAAAGEGVNSETSEAEAAGEVDLADMLERVMEEETPTEDNGKEENAEEIIEDITEDVEEKPEEKAVEEKVVEEKAVEEKTEKDKGVNTGMETYSNKVAVDETSVITGGMTITGDIISEGSVDIIGTVNGNIDVCGKLNITGHISGNSKAAEVYADGAQINGEIVSDGAVKVGASTVIIGNITATSAVIAGAVKGDIDVKGPVVLDTSAIVMGNIKSKSVQINNGAVIEGMCSQCYADVSPTSFFDDYKPEMKKTKSK